MVAKCEVRLEQAVDKPLEQRWLAAPPHREGKNNMIGGVERARCLEQIGLPRLVLDITVPEDRVEAQLANRDPH